MSDVRHWLNGALPKRPVFTPISLPGYLSAANLRRRPPQIVVLDLRLVEAVRVDRQFVQSAYLFVELGPRTSWELVPGIGTHLLLPAKSKWVPKSSLSRCRSPRNA